MSDWPRLTVEGYELVFRLNDVGVDVTPDEVADGLEEASKRIIGGPCRGCGTEDEDLRFGWCWDCVMDAEEAAAFTPQGDTNHIPDERPGSLDAPWMEEPDPQGDTKP